MTETRTPTATRCPVRLLDAGRRFAGIFAAGLALALLTASGGPAPRAHAGGPSAPTHELRVVLDPDSGRIEARSEIDLQTPAPRMPDILLHPRMSVRSVRLDGQEVRFTFEGGRLVPLTAGLPLAAPARLSIEYEGLFPEPVPTPQFGSDNPAPESRRASPRAASSCRAAAAGTPSCRTGRSWSAWRSMPRKAFSP